MKNRRTLFELHAGREIAQLPPDLPLEELNRPGIENDVWFTTSEELVEALGPVGQRYSRPKEYDRMVDLSFTDPLLVSLDRAKAIEKANEAKARQNSIREEGRQGKSKKEVLIRYLRFVHPIVQHRAQLEPSATADAQLDDGILQVFDRNTHGWLQYRGLDVTDVMNWAWILTASTSVRAALRLTLLCSTSSKGTKAVPQFILTFLLRRRSIDVQSLMPLLVYSWKLLEDSESSVSMPTDERSLSPSTQISSGEKTTIIKDDTDGMSERIFIILIIRLLRQARKVWPAACESIVALLNRYLDGINFRKKGLSQNALQQEDIDQLTYVYNTMLRLLSLSSSQHPFQSAIFQQRAQFSLLRRMNQFEPPLAVDKRGYQAVAKMQLMHKKTLKEREWAHMKAKSWPPWKEEKLGIDATIGAEHGISRAKEVLGRAEEAGYSNDEWDAAAGILSGWDTDSSPTIQTRSVTKYPLNVPKQTKESRQGAVWAARIQATRTLDEAWSCFLSWKDQTQEPQTGQQVYLAMSMKVMHGPAASCGQSRRPTVDVPPNEKALPGDGMEVLPAPVSPRDAVYVRRPPPDAEELLEMMKQDGVKPSGRLLAFLIAKTSSFGFGIKCLEASTLQPEHLSALLGDKPTKNQEPQSALESIPTHLFAAFIEFLARFTPTMSDKHGADHNTFVKTGLDPGPSRWFRALDSDEPPLLNPLLKAYELLLVRRPKYRPAWYHLFRSLVRPKAVTGVYSRYSNQGYQDIKTWRMLCSLLDQMLDIDLGLDLDGFAIVCIGLEKAIFASERQLKYKARFRKQNNEDQQNEDGSHHSTYWEHHVLSQGLPLVKELFKDAVRSTGMQQDIPGPAATTISELDAFAEREQEKASDDNEPNEGQYEVSQKDKAFLPPACLLPKILEVPNPAHLHAFIRVLGLRRDYDGILDLIEWMSLFADEIDVIATEARNGRRMTRRCMTAVRVFLERSWMKIPRDDGYDRAGRDGIVIEVDPAPAEVVKAVRDIVRENRKWGGWATEEEVVEYCLRGRFL